MTMPLDRHVSARLAKELAKDNGRSPAHDASPQTNDDRESFTPRVYRHPTFFVFLYGTKALTYNI